MTVQKEAVRGKDLNMPIAISPFDLVSYKVSYKERVSSRDLRRELLENERDDGIRLAGLRRMDKLITFSWRVFRACTGCMGPRHSCYTHAHWCRLSIHF
jgi:hypothetical protein